MLLKQECEVVTAASVDEALRLVAQAPPDLILLDLVMPGRSGFDLLAELAQQEAPPPVIVLSGTRNIATAVEAMKLGAADYLTKPFEVEALRIKVRQLLSRRELEREVVRLRAQVAAQEQLGGLLGRSHAMQEVFQTIRRIAVSRIIGDVPKLILACPSPPRPNDGPGLSATRARSRKNAAGSAGSWSARQSSQAI